ncbi:oligoendopeptidase F, partial [Shigella sonnei]|nr:oligoendopeptidase F [Shigella sonnei]
GEIFGAAADTFSVLNNADLEFPVIEDEKGEKVQLSHGVYGQLLESTDRRVRKDAFEGLYKVYQQFARTFASTLSTNVKRHNYAAK